MRRRREGACRRVKSGVVTVADGTTRLGAMGERVWTDPRGRYHRDGGPAVERDNGAKLWFRHGEVVGWGRESEAFFFPGEDAP